METEKDIQGLKATLFKIKKDLQQKLDKGGLDLLDRLLLEEQLAILTELIAKRAQLSMYY